MKNIILFLILSAVIFTFISLNYNFNKVYALLKTEEKEYASEKIEKALKYRLFTPTQQTNKKYPMVLLLHGASERGNDNKSQLDQLAISFICHKFQKEQPCFVLSPQCPKGKQWLNTSYKSLPLSHYQQASIPESDEMKMIMELITELCRKPQIDSRRIYVIGFSMGASGTWDIISRYPGVFAAASVIAGVSDTTTAPKIRHIPIWAFHGEKDTTAPVQLNKDMQKAIQNAGGNCQLTTFNEGHNCVRSALNYPGFMEWLFQQQKI